MNALIRELANAVRGLQRSPGFTALVPAAVGTYGVLAPVTAVSSAVPTWRALRVNPAEALRNE